MSRKSLITGATPLRIACFTLFQEIGLELEERGRAISLRGIYFPATHSIINRELEQLKQFIDRALKASNAAAAEWEKPNAA